MAFTDKNIRGFATHAYHLSSSQEEKKEPALAGVFQINERLQLDKNHHWLAQIVESSSQAIIGKSLEGIILSWNDAAERLFGYSAASVVNQSISSLFPAEQSEEVQLLITRSGKGEHIDSHEIESTRENGQRVWVSLSLSPIKNKAGTIVGIATIARDITARKHTEDRLYHLAFHDPLTGLPNRCLFNERVNQALAQARRHGHQLALLFIDLNKFKEINDSMGHKTGDRLLQVSARRLRRSVREGDTVARVGGDEFVVCLSVLTDSIDATLIARKIHETLNKPCRIENQEIKISARIGISIYPDDGQDLETLLQVADSAMYHCKKGVQEDVITTPARMDDSSYLTTTINPAFRDCTRANNT